MEKRLYRSKKESMIAGVAGGIAEYFAIDPVLVRLLFVISVFLHGTGILAYIILWIVVPQKKDEYATEAGGSVSAEDPPDVPGGETGQAGAIENGVQENRERREKRTKFGAYLLIGLGVLFLLDNLYPRVDFGDYWPVILIAIGGGLLYNATKKNNHEE